MQYLSSGKCITEYKTDVLFWRPVIQFLLGFDNVTEGLVKRVMPIRQVVMVTMKVEVRHGLIIIGDPGTSQMQPAKDTTDPQDETMLSQDLQSMVLMLATPLVYLSMST